jgi:hypothetical protein
MSDSPGDFTRLLGAAMEGRRDAESQLIALVYDQLRRLRQSRIVERGLRRELRAVEAE